MWLKRYNLKIVLFLALVAMLFSQAECYDHIHKEHFCEIILNLDQCFRRGYRLKYVLSIALTAFLFIEAIPFGQL